jgi:hypothetical protein
MSSQAIRRTADARGRLFANWGNVPSNIGIAVAEPPEMNARQRRKLAARKTSTDY